MNRDPYDNAINNALFEIQKAYPDITHSFIFSNNGSVVTGDTDIDEKTLKTLSESFEPLKEKAKAIGNLKNFTINGKNGKITLCNINGRFFGLTTTDKADGAQIQFITHALLPPLLKTLQTVVPSNASQETPTNVPLSIPQSVPPHLQSPFTKTLVVDPLNGFFDGKAIQVDEETIAYWNKNNDPTKKSSDKVKIETADGNSSICKVKKIRFNKLKGKNKVRVPVKICNNLRLKKGDKVNITPNA